MTSGEFALEQEARQLIRDRPGLAAVVAILCYRPPRAGLTVAQADALAFIKAYIAEHGVSPSIEEMRVALGYASNSYIHRLVVSLEQRGYVTRRARLARSLSLVSE